MAQHEQRHLSDKDRPLKCEFCDRGYVKEFELKKHMELNHGATQRRWECATCGRYFLREHTYQVHLSTPDACAKYVEEKADVETPKIWTNTRLTPRAKESTANFCTVCKLYYKDNKALRLHLVKAMCSQHAKGVVKVTEQYGCHRCEAVFSERPSLIRHLLFQCHKQDLVCDKCGTMFKTEDDHTQHIMLCVTRSTPLNPVLSNAKGIACRKCGTTFTSQRSLASHEGRCKAKPVNISPIKNVDAEKYNLTPCKIRVGKVSDVIGSRLPTGRLRRTPKRYADEAFEKGWAETRDTKAECELQTSKTPKTPMKVVRLSGGNVLQSVGQLQGGKQIKMSSGMRFVVQGAKGNSSGLEMSPLKVVSIGKDTQVTPSTSETDGAMLVESVQHGDITTHTIEQQQHAERTEDTVTVTLSDTDMIAELAAAAAAQSSASESSDTQNVVLTL